MALGTDYMTTTTQAEQIPEVWSGALNDFFRASLVVADFFENWSDGVSNGGDIIHVPSLTEMTAHSKTVGSQVTLNASNETAVDLTINAHYEVSFELEDAVASKILSSYNVMERYMHNAAYTVGATLEDAIIDLFAGFSQTVGDSSTDLNDSNIRAAINYLDVANAPDEDRAFFLYPAVIWEQVQGIDKFSLLTNTNGSDPVLKGHVGYLYGYPVVKTSRLGTSSGSRIGAFAHKSAIAWAVANPVGMSGANAVRIQTTYLQEYLGYLVTADIIYGVIENRDTSGVLIKSSS